MTSFSQIIRAIANILLFAIYALIANTLVGFIVGWFIKYVLGYSIPAEGAAMFSVLAIVTTVIVLLITLASRKYFYMSLDTKK